MVTAKLEDNCKEDVEVCIMGKLQTCKSSVLRVPNFRKQKRTPHTAPGKCGKVSRTHNLDEHFVT